MHGFICVLNNDESDESYRLRTELKAINKKIAQYNLMANVAEYQAEVNQKINNTSYNTFDEDVEKDLIAIKQRLSILESELNILNNIIKKNKEFVDYIEQKKIFIKLKDDSIIQVTRQNLYDYDILTNSNEARKSLLVTERNALKRRIAEIESNREKQLTFDILPSAEEELIHRLAEIKIIGAVEVKTILNGLKKEKDKLTALLLERTRSNNSWINEVYEIAKNYATELKIPDKYKIDIFTHKLKSKSGAILHKLVFIYKLAYIKALSKKLGYPVPIFCDSPNGREVEYSTIHDILSIIKRDFSNHQLLIATIFDYRDIFDDANIVTLDGTLFDQDNLFDYMEKLNK